MSPADSRNGTNRNSVRMFTQDKLSKTAANDKWDRVKVVCTQPFNKVFTNTNIQHWTAEWPGAEGMCVYSNMSIA